MSTSHMVLYSTLGLLFVVLAGWRLTKGTTFKPAGLVIGVVILIIIGSAQLGMVSLEGVEACLQEKGGGRSKLLRCLLHVRAAQR